MLILKGTHGTTLSAAQDITPHNSNDQFQRKRIKD
jgi:hypothetical protein